MIEERVGGKGAFSGSSREVGSLQETRDALARVRTRVLLHLAERHGPAVDRIDDVAPQTETRDLVAAMVERQVGSPAEIRASLLDLIETGYLFAGRNGAIGSPHAAVGLTAHGLVAARLVQPDVSKDRLLRLVLSDKRNAPEFAAKFDTGRPDADKMLNRSGVTLACFYLLAIQQPQRGDPVTLDWFADRIPCLAVGGIGPKSGPGSRLEADKETISEALHLLQTTLAGILPLRRQEDESDGRRFLWFLDAVFPEVRMVVPQRRNDLRDWRVFFLRMDSFFWERWRGVEERKHAAKLEPAPPAPAPDRAASSMGA